MEILRCEYCGADLELKAKTPYGRQRFCSPAHRLIAWRIEKARLPSGDRRWVNKR